MTSSKFFKFSRLTVTILQQVFYNKESLSWSHYLHEFKGEFFVNRSSNLTSLVSFFLKSIFDV